MDNLTQSNSKNYTLSNGETIIEAKSGNYPTRVVVLARVSFGYHPFVTWIGLPQRNNPTVLDCAHGHYFDNLSDAVEDFVNRIERN